MGQFADTLSNIGGGVLGTAALLEAAHHGNLFGALTARQALLANPASRASLVGSPFASGLLFAGGGQGYPGYESLAPGVEGPPAPIGHPTWVPHLPPLGPMQSIEEAVLSNPELALAYARKKYGIPEDPREQAILLNQAQQALQTLPPNVAQSTIIRANPTGGIGYQYVPPGVIPTEIPGVYQNVYGRPVRAPGAEASADIGARRAALADLNKKPTPATTAPQAATSSPASTVGYPPGAPSGPTPPYGGPPLSSTYQPPTVSQNLGVSAPSNLSLGDLVLGGTAGHVVPGLFGATSSQDAAIAAANNISLATPEGLAKLNLVKRNQDLMDKAKALEAEGIPRETANEMAMWASVVDDTNAFTRDPAIAQRIENFIGPVNFRKRLDYNQYLPELQGGSTEDHQAFNNFVFRVNRLNLLPFGFGGKTLTPTESAHVEPLLPDPQQTRNPEQFFQNAQLLNQYATERLNILAVSAGAHMPASLRQSLATQEGASASSADIPPQTYTPGLGYHLPAMIGGGLGGIAGSLAPIPGVPPTVRRSVGAAVGAGAGSMLNRGVREAIGAPVPAEPFGVGPTLRDVVWNGLVPEIGGAALGPLANKVGPYAESIMESVPPSISKVLAPILSPMKLVGGIGGVTMAEQGERAAIQQGIRDVIANTKMSPAGQATLVKFANGELNPSQFLELFNKTNFKRLFPDPATQQALASLGGRAARFANPSAIARYLGERFVTRQLPAEEGRPPE